MKTSLKFIGIILILIGIGLFLVASIGYSSAKHGPDNIVAPPGAEIVVPEGNPERVRLESKAENFLMYSFAVGGIGILGLIIGCAMPKPKPKQKLVDDNKEDSDKS